MRERAGGGREPGKTERRRAGQGEEVAMQRLLRISPKEGLLGLEHILRFLSIFSYDFKRIFMILAMEILWKYYGKHE